MSPRVLNFGSINIDHSYRLARFPQPGETVPSLEYRCGAGGKGFNQSIALARAGAHVHHLGAVGQDGLWLKAKLHAESVNVQHLQIADQATGHAIIQVDDNGQNTIVLFAGTNQSIASQSLFEAIATMRSGDWFLCQNETNGIDAALRAARATAMTVCFNPAPMTSAVTKLPLDCVDLLFVNETEGAGLTDVTEPEAILDALLTRWPHLAVVLTLGARGAIYANSGIRLYQRAPAVIAVDTTAAGDTFIGYFIAEMIATSDPAGALRLACQAAALSVSRPGAADSVPKRDEVRRIDS